MRLDKVSTAPLVSNNLHTWVCLQFRVTSRGSGGGIFESREDFQYLIVTSWRKLRSHFHEPREAFFGDPESQEQ